MPFRYVYLGHTVYKEKFIKVGRFSIPGLNIYIENIPVMSRSSVEQAESRLSGGNEKRPSFI